MRQRLGRWMTFTAVFASILGLLAFGFGCQQTVPLGPAIWSDDEGREIAIQIEAEDYGEVWTGYWVEPQRCPVTGIERPRLRFSLLVDEEGGGVGTIEICRYGFADCTNGPARALFHAEVTVDRIEGTVSDPDCNAYQGREVIRRVRCAPRRPADYLASTSPLEWKEDSSRIESGTLVYRAPEPVRTPGELRVWGISPLRGEVSLVAPTGVRIRASDGELHFGFEPGGEALVSLGEGVGPGSRLARLRATGSGQDSGFELQVLGFTPDLRPTDPHCVRGEGAGAG